MRKSSKPKTELSWWRRHIILIAVLSIFLLPVALPIAYFEINSRIAYYQVDNESKRLVKTLKDTEQTRPLGGIGPSYIIYGRSNGVGSILSCIDVYCPIANTGLLVAIEEGKEDDFINTIFQKFGYPQNDPDPCIPFTNESSTCFVQSHGKFWLSLSIDIADPYHHGAPPNNNDIKPKVWRAVSFSVQLNP